MPAELLEWKLPAIRELENWGLPLEWVKKIQTANQYHFSGTYNSTDSTDDSDFTFDIPARIFTPRNSSLDYFTCSHYVGKSDPTNEYELFDGCALEGRVGINSTGPTVYGAFCVVMTDGHNFDYFPGILKPMEIPGIRFVGIPGITTWGDQVATWP